MAPRGKTTQLHNMFVADFETCDSDTLYRIDEQGNPIYNQRVWLAGFKNLATLQSTWFNNLDDFMKTILARGENVNTEYAFHNLKFDGSYIIPWLFENNFQVSIGKPLPGQFSVLVDNRNNWYSITIQVTKRRKVTLWDSLKLFPTALEYVPNIYATPTKKLREDQSFYEAVRELDHEPTERELQYLENDLQVLAEALREHIELYGLRFKKTQASQSFYNFEQVFKGWKLRFPPLDLDVDKRIRPAYWGGVSYVPPHYAGKDHYGVSVYDINASYPDKAANNKLPYGPPLFEYGPGEHPDMSKFWVAELVCEFELKPHHLPSIPGKAIIDGLPIGQTPDKWLRSSNGPVRILISNIDYFTAHKSYNFTVLEWKWSLHWAWKKHREIKKFVEMNNTIKVENSAKARVEKDPDIKRELQTHANRAKIDNNSFYGKFGEDVIKEGKTPYYDEEDGVTWEVDRVDEQTPHKRKYLPVAIAITAWGRQQLVELANIMAEYFLYSDTDSVHFLKSGKWLLDQAVKFGKLELHPTKLGAWDHEGDFVFGRYLRPKAYIEETEDGDLQVTLAGLPADKHTGQFSKKRSAITKDNFHIGTIIPAEKTNKLRTVRTPTGSKLMPTAFQIKEKDTLFTRPFNEKEVMEQWIQQESKDTDPIQQAVELHGHIQIPTPGEQYHLEYKELTRSTKARYFRREGIPLDQFAELAYTDTNTLMDKIGGN